jgi:hypothetical protein
MIKEAIEWDTRVKCGGRGGDYIVGILAGYWQTMVWKDFGGGRNVAFLETSILTTATRHYNPEDSILNRHLRENLGAYNISLFASIKLK